MELIVRPIERNHLAVLPDAWSHITAVVNVIMIFHTLLEAHFYLVRRMQQRTGSRLGNP
jgi:hypothetical protein